MDSVKAQPYFKRLSEAFNVKWPFASRTFNAFQAGCITALSSEKPFKQASWTILPFNGFNSAAFF